jgi:aryl-alcohol dehydrogenase-like predicted oxidoreductase
MEQDFLHTRLGKLGTPVFRLGLSATYRPGPETLHKALDAGVNYFFFYGFDTHMTRMLRELPRADRERVVLATGNYNLLWTYTDVRKTIEKRLRQTNSDYIDLFHFLGVIKPSQFPPALLDELRKLREEGLVRGIAMSCHDRKFAAKLAREGALDGIMIRYNAAHRGAEHDIFPSLGDADPAVISYTATCWRQLLHRPRGYSKAGRVPDAGLCYRFVLSNPAVHVCLNAPSNLKQFTANLEAVRRGPLDEGEMAFMREFGDLVYRPKH